jgi:hypothetical protein
MNRTSFKCFIIFLLYGIAQMTYADVNPQAVFRLDKPDYKLSPLTGMSRKHWKDAGVFLLSGAFSYVNKLTDPLQFPKQEGKSYPRNQSQVPTEKLEGLCRTLFIAAPLLREDSNLIINHIRLADYYRQQIRMLVDSLSPSYIKPREEGAGPHQNLVEFGGLAVSLFAIPEILWEPLKKTEKDKLAYTMLSYANGPTYSNNWKFFNLFIFSFFKSKGYVVNDSQMQDHLTRILKHYQGNGWYDDNPTFDYYSMWAFQMYGMLWSEFYGKEHEPVASRQFLDNFSALKHNYPFLFGRDGSMIMWGRSISYRFGAAVPFPLMGFENNPSTNYGWMRRIASGTLWQFMHRTDWIKDGVPTLGFYKDFEPAVQAYSCRGSVFWSGKLFLGLLVPQESPFWTATENEGCWEQYTSTTNYFQQGASILVTNYPRSGCSEIRNNSHAVKGSGTETYRGNENYNRLAYNSLFQWQADGPNGEVAMNYIIKQKNGNWEPLRLYTFDKYADGIYYRNAVLETNPNICINLADITLEHGFLRVDRMNSPDSIACRLGHYALPKLEHPLTEKKIEIDGYTARIIDNGHYQLALIPLKGWTQTMFVHTENLNPVSKYSTLINCTYGFSPAINQYFITLILWKKSGEKWSNRDLQPVRKINIANNKVELDFKDKTKRTVLFQ